MMMRSMVWLMTMRLVHGSVMSVMSPSMVVMSPMIVMSSPVVVVTAVMTPVHLERA